jgi:hypothetical protein
MNPKILSGLYRLDGHEEVAKFIDVFGDRVWTRENLNEKNVGHRRKRYVAECILNKYLTILGVVIMSSDKFDEIRSIGVCSTDWFSNAMGDKLAGEAAVYVSGARSIEAGIHRVFISDTPELARQKLQSAQKAWAGKAGAKR